MADRVGSALKQRVTKTQRSSSAEIGNPIHPRDESKTQIATACAILRTGEAKSYAGLFLTSGVPFQ